MKELLKAQKNEITEHIIYTKLSEMEKNPQNKKILKEIASDELEHYDIFRKKSGKDVKPDRKKIMKHMILSKILGITFSIKLMENGEKGAQLNYEKILNIPEKKKIINDEQTHEKNLIKMIDEEKLNYISSVVLGLNDALVEISSTLAGLTLAIQNTKLIALTGFITGVAASISMGASGYLQAKAEKGNKNPVKSLLYTGIAYIITVMLEILPYILTDNVYVALTSLFAIVITLIAGFTYYDSVARDEPFGKKFREMALISLGVAAFTFTLGYIVNTVFKINL